MIMASDSILWYSKKSFLTVVLPNFTLLIVPGVIGNWRLLGGTYQVKWVTGKQLQDSSWVQLCSGLAVAT